MLKDAAASRPRNQRSEWDAGCRFDFPNPSTLVVVSVAPDDRHQGEGAEGGDE